MNERRDEVLQMTHDERDSDGRGGLRTAIIVFAVVEAVVIAAVIYYKLTR